MPEPRHGQPTDPDRPTVNSSDPSPSERKLPPPQTLKLKRLSMGIALGIITVVVIEALLVVFTQPLSLLPPLQSGSAIAQTTPATPNLAPLQTLLSSGDWPAANDETHRLLLETGDRNSSGWLEDSEVEAFACEALSDIDQVWLDASEQRFGFSVQQSLYVQVGGVMGDYQRGAYGLLGQTVGWFGSAADWEATTIPYAELAFQQPGFAPATAPLGHLPIGHNAPNGTQPAGQPRRGGGLRGGVLLRTRCDLTAGNPMAEAPILAHPTPDDASPQPNETLPTPRPFPIKIGNLLLGLLGALALGAIAILVTVVWKRRDRHPSPASPQASPVKPSSKSPSPESPSTESSNLEPDPQAIAQLLNARLQPKGMRAKVARRHKHLVIGIWAKSPVPRSLATHLKGFLEQQGVCRGEVIRVMGYVAGQKPPVWSERVAIASSVSSQTQPQSASKPRASIAPGFRLPLGIEWFLANLLALMMTIFVGGVFVTGLVAVLGADGLRVHMTYAGMGSWLKSSLALLGVGAIAGGCFGAAQRWVLGRRLTALQGWLPATLGSLVVTVLMFQIIVLVPLKPWPWGLVMAMGLAWLPGLQFWVLRSQVRHAWAWLVGHGVALLGSYVLAIASWLFWINLISDQIEVYRAFYIAMLASIVAAGLLFLGVISLTVHLMLRSLPEQPTRR
ncbi:MAG: GUN4 domain-containing protein [Elainellaceae cyanobacterium]